MNYSIKLLKEQVHIILQTIPATKAVIVPILYILLTYTLVGHNLFKGATEYRCRKTPEPVDGKWVAVDNITNLCG